MILFSPASRIAESTVIGIASFNAQEKSTIKTDSVFVIFLVRSQTAPVPSNVYGTSLSARCSALPSTEDFSFSESSIMVTIFSNLVEPETALTRTSISPSSSTVPAKTDCPLLLLTGNDSPVREAWLIMPSPTTTSPSKGITFPIRITTWSPGSISDDFTRISCSFLFSHTLLTLSDILRARSPTDFLCVHSSMISPIPSRNMTDPAVA